METSFKKPAPLAFGKTPGASVPLKVVDAVLETPAESVQLAVAAPHIGFYTGDESEGPQDLTDVRLPRLNIIQGLSKDELKKLGKEGDYVLKGSLLLPQPLNIVACGHKPKVWIEKVKQGVQARFANSLQAVADLGGTDEWRLSKENDKTDSKKIWFMPSVTWLFLIQRPEGADEGYFPYVSEDNIAFAAALYTCKSTSYGNLHVPLASEKATGLLRAGYATRYVELTTRKGLKHPAFEPVCRITVPTSEAVRALAKKAASIG
jgi:hypothetical protein